MKRRWMWQVNVSTYDMPPYITPSKAEAKLVNGIFHGPDGKIERVLVIGPRPVADLDDLFGEPEADWYCSHDVPNGCHSCAEDRAMQMALDSMTDEERQTWLYGPDGTFETYFAPFGPAWQAEMEGRF